MIRVVIRDLEKYSGLQPISIVLLYSGSHIFPPLKEFRPEIHTHIYIQSHAYVTIIYHSMTNPRTFVLKEEMISGTHRVLMFPCCLLYSSVLPQHLLHLKTCSRLSIIRTGPSSKVPSASITSSPQSTT